MDNHDFGSFLIYLKDFKHASVKLSFFLEVSDKLEEALKSQYNIFHTNVGQDKYVNIYLHTYEPKKMDMEDFNYYLKLRRSIREIIDSAGLNFPEAFYKNEILLEYLIMRIAIETRSLYTSFPNDYEDEHEALRVMSDFYLLELSENILAEYDYFGDKKELL